MIKVIGGTYREINVDTVTHDIFGSGLRAVSFILENSKQEVEYYTIGNEETEKHLDNYKNSFNNFNYVLKSNSHLLSFKYYFASDDPVIYPAPRGLKDNPTIKVSEGNIICFGMLDGNTIINSEKVVYDPQTSINPIRFTNRSKAKELVYIVNSKEAKSISNCRDIDDILSFFFDEENVKALIIKNGPYGAKLYTGKKEFHNIPAYKTDKVYKIGSGDIYTASFAFFWFNNENIIDCANKASKATACFCNTNTYKLEGFNFQNFNFDSFQGTNLSEKQVYIASPIFSLSEVILVDKIRNALLGFGIKVFSPYHDVGYGNEKQIAEKDIEGIEKSNIIFSVLDGLDSGTLIELGYAMSNNKKIIGYHRTVNPNSVLMLKAANIKYFNELTTALYQVIWNI